MSASAVLGALLATTGCSAVFGLEPPVQAIDAGDDATPQIDAMPDAMPDAGFCYGTGILSSCFSAAPTGSILIDGPINTTTDSRCSSEVTGTCLIAADMILVANIVDATGSRPLVLLGRTEVSIAGDLDAGSRRVGILGGDRIGAGANPADCGVSPPGGNSTGGGGGGAGGTFGGRGGLGASGDGGAGGIGGTAPLPGSAPTTVRGGCPGGKGGDGDVAGPAGGHGGGAVHIISNKITISGTILVGGQGGRGGGSDAGGGGGGSGGFIGLDAPTIVCSGTLSANGGGGGEGGGTNSSSANGASAIDATQQAAGGSSDPDGGNGGDGSFATVLDGEDGETDADGGGGGGGGAGFIKLYPPRALGCAASPPTT